MPKIELPWLVLCGIVLPQVSTHHKEAQVL